MERLMSMNSPRKVINDMIGTITSNRENDRIGKRKEQNYNQV